MAFSPAAVTAALERQRLIQTTRRDIAAKVRDDWEWPPVAPPPPPPKLRKPQRPQREGQLHRSDGEVADDEDGEDTSSTDADEEEPRLPNPLLTPPAPKSWACRTLDTSSSPSPNSSPPHSPYRFEHPDAIGPSIAAQERSRRTKRRRLLEEEMCWNDGLRCWVARRDAWSGAKTTRVDPLEQGETNGDNPPVTPPESPTLIPLSAPLHPLHPPPGQLPPVTHPHIYAKIVLKSQTPSVPINLKDLTAALVQGWKDDDQWPPKAAVAVMAVPAAAAAGGSGGAGMGSARRVAGSSTAATGA
ncbi:MAG: hypothetical protein M1840_004774 [Geoglossum simile]|nr:MAG: hypothetical protein M1840_004774 [Geoglossum simile]